MDLFSRDLPGLTGYDPPRPSLSLSSSYRPQSSGHLSRPQRNPLRPHHPPTPPTLPSVPIPSHHGQPIDPVRKITPPEEKEKLAVAKEHKSPYDQAYAYVQECRVWRTGPGSRRYPPRPLEDYERPLSIKMSGKDWIKLSSDLNLGGNDEVYPRLSYNASTSTLIIQCMPSPLHQSITSTLGEQFSISKANLPTDLRRKTLLMWEEDRNGFRGQWENSRKRPDLSIKVRNANGKWELKWVLEVGFSETYEELVDDTRLWLEGYPEVSMVTLVKFHETPKYRCPVLIDKDLEELGIPLDMQAIDQMDIILGGQFGPATYKGLMWVGQISEVFIEIWVRDADGRAVQHGNRKDLLQADQLQMSFGDFLPPGYPQTITLDLNEFRSLLEDEIQEFAVYRCREVLREYKKRMGQDRDYEP